MINANSSAINSSAALTGQLSLNSPCEQPATTTVAETTQPGTGTLAETFTPVGNGPKTSFTLPNSVSDAEGNSYAGLTNSSTTTSSKGGYSGRRT